MIFSLIVIAVIATVIIHTSVNYGNACIVITINFKTLINKIKNMVNKL
jgi:hypothetical protein